MPKICSVEGCNNPIWSRKSGKCKYHIEKTTTKRSQSVTPSKRKAVKSVSPKQVKSNIKVKGAKRNVMQKHLNEYGYFFCKSCGTKEGRIDLSHLVPIGYNKSLEANEKNITLHCSGCHSAWERLSKEIKDFRDFKDLLSRVKQLDESYYNKIISRL